MVAIYSQTHQRQTMKKFVFQTYNKIQSVSKSYDDVFVMLKLWLLMLAIVACGLVYVVYVNKASTHGYFYRVESKKLDAVIFEHNLVKLDVMKEQQNLREKSTFSSRPKDPISIETSWIEKKVVRVETKRQVAMR